MGVTGHALSVGIPFGAGMIEAIQAVEGEEARDCAKALRWRVFSVAGESAPGIRWRGPFLDNPLMLVDDWRLYT